jgi:hypothetical protein
VSLGGQAAQAQEARVAYKVGEVVSRVHGPGGRGKWRVTWGERRIAGAKQ